MVKINYGFEKRRKEMEKKRKKEEKAKAKAEVKKVSSSEEIGETDSSPAQEAAPASE